MCENVCQPSLTCTEWNFCSYLFFGSRGYLNVKHFVRCYRDGCTVHPNLVWTKQLDNVICRFLHFRIEIQKCDSVEWDDAASLTFMCPPGVYFEALVLTPTV